MNEQTLQALIQLLGDIVSNLNNIKETMTRLEEKQQAMLEQLKPKPKKASRSKKKEEAAPVEDKFEQLETAIQERMSSDFGEDMPRPLLTQKDATTFVLNGVDITNEDMGNINAAIAKFDAATPSDIANELGLPVEAVYMVQVLTQGVRHE